MALVKTNQATHSSLVRRTLWRIETELSQAPSLSDLAEAEGVSRFHLMRAFSVVTGRTVMSYVRARRLSEAANRLRSSDDRLLTIALDAGYDSHEAFARAFKDMFGAPPSAVRADPNLIPRLQEPIVMTSEPLTAPEPRIVDRSSQKIVGVSEAYTMDTRVRIPAQWERTVEEFGSSMMGGETFGVCYGFDGASFRYLAGVAAKRSWRILRPD